MFGPHRASSSGGFSRFMTLQEEKEEVLMALKTSRQWHSVQATKNWRRAFDLYHVGTGIRMMAEDNCSKCYTAVLEWLKK